MMRYFVVTSEEEIADIAKRMAAEGYKLAIVSNAGLPPQGHLVPRSVFKEPASPPIGYRAPPTSP